MKPVRLPAAATIALPRWSIIALCLLYILPGLIARDPWKGSDGASFGIMWTMAHGTLEDWLWPHIVGLPMPEEGPLAFWFGAVFIKFFGGWVGDPFAARISSGLAFAISALAVWHSTFLLGRRTEAQPLKLAFGGQPEPTDFGRTLADGALLIFLGCFGLLLPSHTTSTAPLFLALISTTLYLSLRFFESSQKKWALGLGLTLGLLTLTRGWPVPAAMIVTLILLSAYRKQKFAAVLSLISLPAALAVVAIWIGLVQTLHPFSSSPLEAWKEWNLQQFAIPSVDNLIYFLRYGIWFSWPAWPFAAWAIYAWRKQERTLHISLPAGMVLCFFILLLANPSHEESNLLPLLPPLAILAAFGLPTMKRSAINAVDWFAVMIMTGAAGLFWFAWLASQTGWPIRTSHKVLSWAPGFLPSFNLLSFILALAVTIIWFRIVYWRISRQPSVLWRAVVLSTGGVILCWFLLMSLWLPLINHRVSYAEVAKDMSSKIEQPYRCIDSTVGAAQRASFAYFADVHFAGFNEQNCELLLTQKNRRTQTKHTIKPANKTHQEAHFPGEWEVIWEGQRAADQDEFFTLYRKRAQAPLK